MKRKEIARILGELHLCYEDQMEKAILENDETEMLLCRAKIDAIERVSQELLNPTH